MTIPRIGILSHKIKVLLSFLQQSAYQHVCKKRSQVCHPSCLYVLAESCWHDEETSGSM
ncbi:MAG: hypothetical protein QF470_07875 [Methylococcales bacterium]|nr:hypothetical protein [Methylococcales bacterium]